MSKVIPFLFTAMACAVWPSTANFSSVPVPLDYKVIMHVDNKYPLVQTGYSAQTMSEVVTFYNQQLGKPDLNRHNTSYSTLYYSIKDQTVRISLLERDYKTHIAIMITK